MEILRTQQKQLDGYAGVSTPGDGLMVENHDIRWRREKWDGEDHICVRFKVTDSFSPKVLESMQKEFNATQGKIPLFKQSVIDKETGAINHTYEFNKDIAPIGVQAQLPGGHTLSMSLADADMYPKIMATKNYIELKIKTGSIEEAHKVFDSVAQKLGINAAVAPTIQETESMVKARIIAQWDREAWKTLKELKTITYKDIDDAWAGALKRNENLEKILKDSKITEVAAGHKVPYSNAQAAEFDEAGVTYLYHETPDAKVIPLLFDKDESRGGLLSSLQRYERGVFVKGQSTYADFESGGADSVFTRISRQEKMTGVGGQAKLVIDKKVMGRSDWFFYNSDEYGSTRPGQFEKRVFAPRVKKLVKSQPFVDTFDPNDFLGSSNEVMFQHGIHQKDILAVVVRNLDERNKIIQALRDKGLETINGKALEDFIVKGN